MVDRKRPGGAGQDEEGKSRSETLSSSTSEHHGGEIIRGNRRKSAIFLQFDDVILLRAMLVGDSLSPSRQR